MGNIKIGQPCNVVFENGVTIQGLVAGKKRTDIYVLPKGCKQGVICSTTRDKITIY